MHIQTNTDIFTFFLFVQKAAHHTLFSAPCPFHTVYPGGHSILVSSFIALCNKHKQSPLHEESATTYPLCLSPRGLSDSFKVADPDIEHGVVGYARTQSVITRATCFPWWSQQATTSACGIHNVF